MPFIPLEVFANNPTTTVTAGGTTAPAQGTQESWTVTSSTGFPVVELGATQFHVADPAAPTEMITVQNVSGLTWTVLRGAESSGTVAHAAGFTIVQVVTAAVLSRLSHPPWQFPVQQYKAQGDGKIGTGGTGASGQPVLTDAAASFVNAPAPAGDVNKVIIVNQGAGSASVATNPFTGTITAVNSATSITLSGNLAATCTNAPYIYGTDDSAAITDAVNAAATWAKTTGNYKAQIVFEPQNYMLGAVTQQTSPVVYNTHIPVPYATDGDRRLTLDFLGVGDAAEPMWWGGAVPSMQGTCLVSAVYTASQPDGTYGQMSVIGVPNSATGLGNGGLTGSNFANVLVNITGLTVVTPYNTQQFGFDFRYAAQVSMPIGAAVVFAPVNYSAASVGGTWIRPATIPTNGVAVGLAMPRHYNNDNSDIGEFSAEGISRGILLAEHINIHRLTTIYCDIGLVPETSGYSHSGTIAYWSCEGCNYGIATDGNGGVFPLNIMQADFEAITTSYVTDTGGCLTGVMYWHDVSPVSPSAGVGLTAPHYKVINQRQYPGIWVANAGIGIPAAPAAPASNTAQQNTAYRDATVWASAGTSITSFTVADTSAGLASSTVVTVTAGANVGVPIRVPSGYWWKATYSGTLTTTWVLE